MRTVVRLFWIFGLFFLFSCGNNPAVKEDIVTNEDTLTKTKIEEPVPVNYAEVIIGKWDYVETINTVGDVTVNIKAMYMWTMEYKADGTFFEQNQLAEGEKTYTLEGPYTLEDSLLKRKGAVEVTIEELTADKLVLNSFGAKMIFKKM